MKNESTMPPVCPVERTEESRSSTSADGDGLLILDQRRGVVADAERRVHHVLVAHHAQAPATGHLAAGIHLRQSCRRVASALMWCRRGSGRSVAGRCARV